MESIGERPWSNTAAMMPRAIGSSRVRVLNQRYLSDPTCARTIPSRTEFATNNMTQETTNIPRSLRVRTKGGQAR